MIEIRTKKDLIPADILPQLSTEQLTKLARNLADAAYAKWVKLGQADPSSRRQEYLQGIQEPVVSYGTATITLVGTVPNMYEHGAPARDLREVMLGENIPTVDRGSRGKHEAKEGGYYRAIPFRHTNPGAVSGIGQPMGRAYSDVVTDAKKLGKEVYGQAKQLRAYVPGQENNRLPGGMAPKLKDHHATDIFAGMIREEKTYEKATQSQYFTFRTISTHITRRTSLGWVRVPATIGWAVPAIQARGYAKKVSEFVEKIAPEAARALLESTL